MRYCGDVPCCLQSAKNKLTTSQPFAELLEQAKRLVSGQEIPCAVIAGAHDPHALLSAIKARDLSLIRPILIGKRTAILQLTQDSRIDLADSPIEDVGDEDAIALRTAELAGTDDIAVIIKGQIHTDVLMRALLAKEYGLRIGRRASHTFLLETPKLSPMLISDAALNIDPDEVILLDIAKNAITLAENLAIPVRAALLSASEVPSPIMPSSTRAAAILQELQHTFPNAAIAGPYALDIAISPTAAQRKGIENPVAGFANILIVPNIETGNALYKMMVWRLDATAAGVISGLRLPVAVASRSDPPAARLGSLALAICSAYGEKSVRIHESPN